MSTTVHVGDVSPIGIELDVIPSSALPDLTAVVSATLEVQSPSNSTPSWVATITVQTLSTLHLQYLFATGDLTERGTWTYYAHLVTAAGAVDTARSAFTVLSKFEQ